MFFAIWAIAHYWSSETRPCSCFRAYPTEYLYFRFYFDFVDASDQVIREAGIFLNTVTDPSLPAGQKYFDAADIDAAGELLLLDNLQTKIVRTPASRATFEYVIKI